LQQATFFGYEKKPLPATLVLMNMVLHGVMNPQIRRRNTLEENIRNVSQRFDVVLINPPFGGTENARSSKTSRSKPMLRSYYSLSTS